MVVSGRNESLVPALVWNVSPILKITIISWLHSVLSGISVPLTLAKYRAIHAAENYELILSPHLEQAVRRPPSLNH